MFEKLDEKIENTLLYTSPTFVTLQKIRGFTLELLFQLRNRELTAVDLVDLTGKYPQYINRYLYNMRKYGLVQKNGSFWRLTEFGLSLLSHLESLDVDIDIIRKKKERSKKEGRKKKESSFQRRTIQTSFSIWLENYHRTLEDAEKSVVDILLDHYDKTESKYIYCSDTYEMAKKFQIRPDQVTRVMRNLKADRITYARYDPVHSAWKVALYKPFLEKLEAQKVDASASKSRMEAENFG